MSYSRSIVAFAIALASLGIGIPAFAQAHDDAFELSLGPSYTSVDGFSFSTAGLRWSHSFNPEWGLEIAASSDDLDDFDHSQRFIDVSARYTFFDREDWEVFAFWGGGMLTYRAIFVASDLQGNLIFVDRGNDETSTAHVGLGARWSFNDRLYLRPELRYRDHFDVFSSAEDDSFEGTVALGWRF